VQQGLSKLHIFVADDELEHIVRMVDTDGDGQLSLEEFAKGLYDDPNNPVDYDAFKSERIRSKRHASVLPSIHKESLAANLRWVALRVGRSGYLGWSRVRRSCG
jgi:hypothetical protein